MGGLHDALHAVDVSVHQPASAVSSRRVVRSRAAALVVPEKERRVVAEELMRQLAVPTAWQDVKEAWQALVHGGVQALVALSTDPTAACTRGTRAHLRLPQAAIPHALQVHQLHATIEAPAARERAKR